MPYLIDTHIHLNFDQYKEDLSEVIARASESGVKQILTVGIGDSIEKIKESLVLADTYENVFASVGVHPLEVGIDIDFEEVLKLTAHPKVVAIGETGLDYFHDKAPKEVQVQYFEKQIQIAIQTKKPLIIHSREAGEDCISILKKYKKISPSLTGVFHCYAEDAAFAKRLAEIDFLVSFTGVTTFKKADPLREIIREIPLTKMMVETDGPYMAPEPFRGKRSESAHVVQIAATIARVKSISVEEVWETTTQNAIQLFKLPAIQE